MQKNYEFTSTNQYGFHEFLVNENFTDSCLVCEKTIIKCHKIILAASSKYFYELFKMLDTNNPTIVLKDITLKQLMKILEYIYCRKVSVAENELKDFKEAAEYFQMDINFPEKTNDFPEFMSQETTVGNLTLDSFSINDSETSENELTFTESKIGKEPEIKKIKLTDSFGMAFTMRPPPKLEATSHERKRNYFEFSDELKKKVAFDILKEKCVTAKRHEFKPKKSFAN